MKLQSKIYMMIFSYLDQFDCVRYQGINRDSYHVYFPRVMKSFTTERPYIHLFDPLQKCLVVCYLDNYKAK